MRTSGLALLPALLITSISVSAQDVQEAYNLSNLTVQGTARSMGFGNALGSVGADFSSISVNPAGLGVYRSSELTFTPSLRINGASTDYAGTNTADNNTHFNINNFGLVITSAPKGKRYERRNWKTVSFAFGMNRTADFNLNYSYTGKNTTSSASQVFESDANYDPTSAYALGPSSGLGYMGYQSYLLNKDALGQYYTIVPFTGGVSQTKTVQVNGGVNEYTLALGGNYKEKLMLGVSVGIPSVKYSRTSYYKETLAAGNNAANPYGFQYFSYNQDLSITGSGFNLKLGAIYKVSDNFRVGASFHSPTIYSITDVSTPTISSQHNDTAITLTVGDYEGGLVQNQFDYTFVTPWRAVVSATFLFKKLGFITADYEYVGYNSMRYRFPSGVDNAGYSFKDAENIINQDIKNIYRGASNFRLGAEARLGKFFMVRLGGGYYGNPYKTSTEGQRIDVSAGCGFRFKHFFTDFALVHSMYKGMEQPYYVDYSTVISGASASVPVATTNYSINNVALTLGVKF